MLSVFFKIILRNFIKEKFFSAINVAGLAVGISVALIIALFILHELSYDRFHEKYNRIYRIVMHLDMGGNATDVNATFPLMAKAVQEEIPEIASAVRVYLLHGIVFKHENRVFTEDRILYADPGFFDVFTFHVLAGDPTTALRKRGQVLLTPALANKYFQTANWSEVVGKSILVNQETFEITGIVEEAPANSHFHFSAIASMESTPQGRDLLTWDNMNVSTYLLLNEDAGIEEVVNKIPDVFRKRMKNFDGLSEEGVSMHPIAQALPDIHLYSNVQGEFEPTGSIVTLYIFSSVALIVLLLACVNFINLVTARSANRAKEVGVRKVLGSSAQQLMRQFAVESILTVLIATLLSLGLIELMRYPFNQLSGKELPFHLFLTPPYLLLLLAFVIVLGLLAGSYPAFFLASYKPAQVLKGKVRSGFKSSQLRNGLVMLQFVISMVLITCTLIVQYQLDFMRSRKLGFDKENILIIENAHHLSSQQAYVHGIQQVKGVNSAGAARFKAIDDYDGMPMVTEEDKDNRKLVNFSSIDHDYLTTLNYEFVAGRNFSKDNVADSSRVILNERAADFLFGGEAVGKKISPGGEGDNAPVFTIVGVVKDFNFESLKNEVRPMVFFLNPDERYLHVRLNPGDFSETIARLETLWKQQSPDLPFTFTFLDDTYSSLFKEEAELGALFSIFTGLALFIACLGLIGLAAYMAEQRKKEISVRKVLGATIAQLVMLMSRDFARIMVIAFIIAVPLGYMAMNRWLDGFAYKVNVSFMVFIAGGVLVMVIALLAVSFQAIRAALLNPVESLKEE